MPRRAKEFSRSGDADDIVSFQRIEQARGKVGIDDSCIIMGEYDDFTACGAQAAVVARGKRTGIVNADDFVFKAGE